MKEKLKGRLGERKVWVGIVVVAMVLAMAATAVPVHIVPHGATIGQNGILTLGTGQYHIVIGNTVGAAADYTCDGTDDNVQFQAALDALPASGGQLFVLTGSYQWADTTTVTRAIDNVSIVGVGGSVSFTGDGVTALFSAGGNNWLFANLKTDAGGLTMGATTDWMWLNLTIGTTYYALDTEDDPAVDTSGTPVDDDFAKFTDADTVEGRSYGEVRTDLSLVPDTDIPAQASFDDHSTRHENAGADEISVADLSGLLADDQHVLDAEVQAIKLDDFATPDDNIDLNASVTRHGLLLKLGGGTTNFLRADGTWAAPPGGGVDTSGTPVATDYARFTDADTIEGREPGEVRSDLSLEVGTDVQAYDASLLSIAALGTAADRALYATALDTWAEFILSSYARGFLDDADEATFKATVNLEAGTDYPSQSTFDDHSARHAVSGADTIFPVDPNADRYLLWDDDPGELIWTTVAGGGDVSGPATSTDHMIARHDGTGGKTLIDYTSNPPTISDTGDMNIDGDLDVENIIASGNVDGRDVSVDGTKLDGVETLADVTDSTNVNAAGAVMESDGIKAVSGEVQIDKSIRLPELVSLGATLADYGYIYADTDAHINFYTDAGGGTNLDFSDHSAEHENAGDDEINVAGLSGLLADDQHVLDAEVQAIKLDDFATPDDNTDLDASLTEHGLLLKLGGGTTNFLRADGTWAAPLGGGDVSGPATSTDHMIARHDGVGGKTLIDYTSNPPTISDAGDINIDGDLDVENIVASGTVDGIDVSAHDTATTGVHGMGADTIAGLDDIGVDANLSAEAQDAVTKRHTQGSDTALGAVGTKDLPIDADKAIYRDSTDSDALVTSTWTQIKAFLKTYFDTFYATITDLSNHAADPDAHGEPTVATDSGTATADDLAFSIVGGEGIDTSGATTTVTITGEDATDANKGIASFDVQHFTLTAGDVDLNIDDTAVDGETDEPITSNWAYDHDADGSAHQSNVITITFIIDGGGSAIATGEHGHIEIPFACTITGWTILADQSGDIVIDVWSDTYANFPPTVADTIAGSEKPTLSTAQKNQDLALGTWTTAVTAGDILAFNVDSAATVERITLSIRATKT